MFLLFEGKWFQPRVFFALKVQAIQNVSIFLWWSEFEVEFSSPNRTRGRRERCQTRKILPNGTRGDLKNQNASDWYRSNRDFQNRARTLQETQKTVGFKNIVVCRCGGGAKWKRGLESTLLHERSILCNSGRLCQWWETARNTTICSVFVSFLQRQCILCGATGNEEGTFWTLRSSCQQCWMRRQVYCG